MKSLIRFGIGLAIIAGAVAIVLVLWPREDHRDTVVRAASFTEKTVNEDVRSFRYHRFFTWGPNEREGRDGSPIEVTFEVDDHIEYVFPDRSRRLTTRTDVLVSGSPDNWVFGKTRWVWTGCPGVSDVSETIIVGATSYEKKCDETWVVSGLPASEQLVPRAFTELETIWESLRQIDGVHKIDETALKGIPLVEYSGTYRDPKGNVEHYVRVWIGSDDGLVHRFEDKWGKYTVEIEQFDFNDESISIAPPNSDSIAIAPSIALPPVVRPQQ